MFRLIVGMLSLRGDRAKAALMTVLLALVMRDGTTAQADPTLPTIPANTFTITSFGAVGDGTTDNAIAIQNTINAAALVGGGTVVVAAVGVLTNYLSGPIALSNNVCLQMNGGTKLQMLPFASWPGTTAFISASKLHDVEINGTGTIDGNAGFTSGFFTNWWGPPPPSNSPVASRPNFINFSGCTNILIQNVTLQNPPTFHIMVKGNNVNLTIQGITENTSPDSHNTDGMDLASTNVLIRNCSISVGDDNIEIGGSGGPAANVTISNCFFGTGHGLSIGSLIATQFVGDVRGVHDLLVSNCTFNGTEYGIHMKSDRDRGGTVKNARYLDLVMTNVNFPIAIYGFYNTIGTPKTAINFTPLAAATNGPQTVTGTTPIWRDITISNLTATAIGGNIAGIIMGLPEMLASNITLYNVNITAPTNTFCIYHAQAIRIINSNLTAPNTATNTLTLYNADITVTNSAANTNLVTLGGLAFPPTNNTLAFFNARVAITDTNELGAGPITLGGSTLTLTQASVSVSNNISVASPSTLAFTGGVNKFAGTFSGPLAVNLPTGTLLFYGSGTFSAGGAPSTLANLTVGDCGLSITGSVTVSGSTLYVTNAAHNAVLDVRDGTFTITSGAIVADKLVMTNACGRFLHIGGSVTVTTEVLDPNLDADGDGIANGYEQSHGLDPLNPADANADNDGDGFSNLQEFLAGTDPNDVGSTPLRITVIARESNNIRVTWNTFPGTTNALQATAGGAGGSYSTNNFATIFTVTNTGGSTTNYLDIGGATNFPARYYRVRLVP